MQHYLSWPDRFCRYKLSTFKFSLSSAPWIISWNFDNLILRMWAEYCQQFASVCSRIIKFSVVRRKLCLPCAASCCCMKVNNELFSASGTRCLLSAKHYSFKLFLNNNNGKWTSVFSQKSSVHFHDKGLLTNQHYIFSFNTFTQRMITVKWLNVALTLHYPITRSRQADIGRQMLTALGYQSNFYV